MNIPIQLATLANVTGDEGRYNFNAVHIEQDGSRASAIATNGQVLVAASWHNPAPAETRHVDGANFEEAAKIAKAKKVDTIDLPPSLTKETPFPPYKKFEAVPGSAIRMELDSLALALEAIGSILKQPKKKGVEPLRVDLFVPLSNEHPIELRAARDDFRVTAVIPNKSAGEVYPRAI